MFRELARKNKKISMEECIEVLKSETRGVVSVLGDDDYPYGMPMNHFYNEEDGKIYFHCGKYGHRLDALKKHDKVSFCVFDQGYRNEGEWALNVKSIIVFGRMENRALGAAGQGADDHDELRLLQKIRYVQPLL